MTASAARTNVTNAMREATIAEIVRWELQLQTETTIEHHCDQITHPDEINLRHQHILLFERGILMQRVQLPASNYRSDGGSMCLITVNKMTYIVKRIVRLV